MASQGLFRQEAVDTHREEWLGSIQLTTAPSRALVLGAAGALTLAILSFLYFGHYTRRATVPGELVPTSGLLNVTAAHGGVVHSMAVHVGERVVRGQALLTIDNELDSARLGSTGAIVSAQLQAQRIRLEADLTDQDSVTADQQDGLRSRWDALLAQRLQVQGQIQLEQQSVRSLDALLHKILPLREKGYVSVLQIQQQQLADLSARSQLKALRGQSLALNQQVADLRHQLAELPLQAAARHHATQNQLAQIETSLAQNELQRALVLRAPEAGIVSSLVVKPGQSVASGQALMSVVPQNASLEAQLLVPGSAIGFMRPGERVLLRYQAFPYQKFGLHTGRVVEVSRSALDPQEAATLLGRPVKASFYRVLVALHAQAVAAYGQPQALRPGMAFTADVLLDRRRLVDWIFEPLLGMRQRIAAESRP